jgi:hypothetical protein
MTLNLLARQHMPRDDQPLNITCRFIENLYNLTCLIGTVVNHHSRVDVGHGLSAYRGDMSGLGSVFSVGRFSERDQMSVSREAGEASSD